MSYKPGTLEREVGSTVTWSSPNGFFECRVCGCETIELIKVDQGDFRCSNCLPSAMKSTKHHGRTGEIVIGGWAPPVSAIYDGLDVPLIEVPVLRLP